MRNLQFDIRLLRQKRLHVAASILVILLFLTGGRTFGIALSNMGLLRLLHASLCDPDWYACGLPKSQFPPQHWQGNGDQLAQAFVIFEQAAQLAPYHPAIQEYLIAIEYALGWDTQATRRFEELATRDQLRPAVFSPDGSPAFHFLHSRAQEAHADLQGAIEAEHQGLQLAHFALSPEREAKEVQRLSDLYGNWIRSVDPAASSLYAATLPAACAADWNNAWARAERILPDLPLLDSEQRSVIVRLLAYRARLDGDALQESKWLAKADPLGWDQWSIGDPYLWLGKKLSDKGLEECSAGPLSIFSWYTDQQSTERAGLVPAG